MEYRRLGRTELQVSVLGVGCGYLGPMEQVEGTRILERAFELGLNYFDGRYGDSNSMLQPLMAQNRDRCVVVTKTNDQTAEGAMRRIEGDLGELGTDYVDVFLLRTYNQEMLRGHLAPGGSMEAAQRAKETGKVRAVGMSGHTDMSALVAGIETGLVDVVLFPLNIVRRESLGDVIPAALEHDVGVTIMKPVSVGLAPEGLALRWLANQPIHTMVPGMASIDELERDVAAIERESRALSREEKDELEVLCQRLEREACHQCEACEPCPEGIDRIFGLIYSDVAYNHYRNMGLEAYLAHPWAAWTKKGLQTHFERRLETLRSCTRCGICEERCPHDIRILDLFESMLEDHPPLIAALKERGWKEEYAGAESPYG